VKSTKYQLLQADFELALKDIRLRNDRIKELEEEISQLKNVLTGYKLSNQSLQNSLEKEIKENERLRNKNNNLIKEYGVEIVLD
jgi:predicted RNase H-like nuclease (RuvC/YqgF family)